MAKIKRICSIVGCGKPSRSNGLCMMHETRRRRYGDPLARKIRAVRLGKAQLYYRDVVQTYAGQECLFWPFSRTKGYATLRQKYVSRLLCEETYGPPPLPSFEAAHSCGNGNLGCVARGHVLWKTGAENQMDRVNHGTSNRGERHGQSKLTKTSVLQIRKMENTHHIKEVAALFRVSESAIRDIYTKRRWTWL